MANLVYVKAQTTITWLASGGTNVLTLTSVASAAGRQGAMHNFNFDATSLSRRYEWRFYCKFATAPVVGEVIYIYWKSSDGTHYDNDDGTGDAAVSAQDKLKNLKLIGVLVVDEASTTPEFSASGEFEIHGLEGAPVIWNATADALSGTAADHGFILTPIPDEIQ